MLAATLAQNGDDWSGPSFMGVNRLAGAAANVNPAYWRQVHMLDPLTSLVAARIKEARGNLARAHWYLPDFPSELRSAGPGIAPLGDGGRSRLGTAVRAG
jgi:hypothetical protein